MSASLPFPNEPLDLKKKLKITLEVNNNNYKSLLIGNRLPAYLWSKSNWKNYLIRNGWTWQEFLKFFSDNIEIVSDWVTDKISWGDFIMRISQKIYTYKPLRDMKII